MSNNKTGGAAFPVTATEQSFHNQTPLPGEPGMTLLDYVAAKVLPELIKTGGHSTHDYANNVGGVTDDAVKASFSIAETFIRERQKYIS